MNDLRIATIAALLLLLWVGGCATQADIQAEQRARDALRAQFADNRAALDEIRGEVARVRGEVEELRYRLDRVARERGGTSPQVKSLEDRIAALERDFRTRSSQPPLPPGTAIGEPPLPPGPTARPGPAAQPPPDSVPVRPATPESPGEDIALAKEPVEAQDEYKMALRTLREQQYDRAIQQFRAFQRKYPNSEMADDAQYWIGESYFAQKDYNRAILEFNDVLKYRRGDKVPAALLRQAQAFLEIGDQTDARLILQKLINDYPNSEPAKEARDKLRTLGR